MVIQSAKMDLADGFSTQLGWQVRFAALPATRLLSPAVDGKWRSAPRRSLAAHARTRAQTKTEPHHSFSRLRCPRTGGIDSRRGRARQFRHRDAGYHPRAA